MKRKSSLWVAFRGVGALICAVFMFGCSHSLQVKNLNDFIVPITVNSDKNKCSLGVKPFNGTPDETWYFNSVVEKLSQRKDVGQFGTDYVAQNEAFKPDYVLNLQPKVEYESSWVNWFICCPGSFIFTAAWNGYVYHANIMLDVSIYDRDGNQLKKITINTPYSIRHASFGRTWYPIFSWNVCTPIGATYAALVYNSDVTPEFKNAVQSNFASYAAENVMKALTGLGGIALRDDIY